MPNVETKFYPHSTDEALTWSEQEFISANLGDKRLNKRVAKIAYAFINKPNANIPQSTGSWADAKGAYRFFSNPKVTHDKIIAPHKEATKSRLNGNKIILAIQDTSSTNYHSHPSTEGLGPAGNLKTPGLMLHPTLAVSTGGTPLGLIDFQIWAREFTEEEIEEKKRKGRKENKKDKDKKRAGKKAEDKESFKWIKSFRATREYQKELDGITFVNVCDREGDFFNLFAESLSCVDGINTELLVRACQDRRIEGEYHRLWESIKSLPVRDNLQINVPRQKNRAAREANLAIRFGPVSILPPSNLPEDEFETLRMWAVFAHEEECPVGAEKISWMLLTTIPVNNIDDALEKIEWYTRRWMIELFFKVLKSGCEIEERQLEHATRLKSCIAIDCVVAWRILFLTFAGREVPDLPASVIFEEYEWKALYSFIHTTPNPPDEEPTLQTVTRQIAQLGGFLGRKRDGEPGMITLWRGTWRMIDIVATYKIFRPN